MSPRISIIIPVYNVELSLRECVCSILDQGLEEGEFEIILVDDGSTDHSGVICEEFARTNTCIKVIHQSNKGLSEARNAGMRVARGQYIQFVDSDDYLEENVVPKLLEEMEQKDLDILRFQVRQVYENKEPSSPLFEFSSIETQKVIAGARYLQDYMGIACYVCQFLFRSSFLLENSLWFMPGIIFEDTEWTPRIMNLANRVSSVNILVYDYLEREGSITRGSAEKKMDGQLILLREMKKQLSEVKERKWHEGLIAHLVVSIITNASTVLFSQRKEIIEELKEMDIIPLSTYHTSTRVRRKIDLINISPSLACLMIHLLNI